jgi:hypothetical protein
MRKFIRLALACAVALTLQPVGAWAQTTTPALTPEALALAKQLVAKIEPAPQQTIATLSGPMVGMIQQMGIQDPVRARALVQEAVMPILSEHVGGLVDLSAQAYAQTLSVDDLKATLAFYDTKAGQDLIRAQPALAQLRLTGMTQWMSGIQPEMQAKIVAMIKQHGWDKQ